MTGLREYVRCHAPDAVNMPPASYDEYFVGPWATERKHEVKHRELTKAVGDSLKGKLPWLLFDIMTDGVVTNMAIHIFI